jgi:stage V sporulation protein D (sporulation-specific penicillin-binding protein)
VGAVEIVEKMPKAQWRDYLRRFWFGQISGVDLAGEVANPLTPLETWWDSNAATIAFGQGIAVTPIQMVDALAAVANQGRLMRPEVVRSITDPDSGRVSAVVPVGLGQAIRPETARAMLTMMVSVVERGTGLKARIPGYTVAGKTGTATIPVAGRYTDEVIASFAGVVPAGHPRFVMLVTITRPRGGAHGADVSAPIFQKVASYILSQWQVPPQ